MATRTRMRLPPRLLYRLFPLAGRLSFWVAERFPGPGRLVLGLLVTGMLFGIDMRQTLGYQVAAFAFALLLTGRLLSLRWRPRLAVRRVLPDVVTEGVPAAYFVEITNLGPRTERDLVLKDTLETPRISYETFQRRRRAAPGAGTNLFDRAIGFPRWVEMRRRGRGADIELTEIAALAPGATARVRIEMTPARRGWLRFERSRLLRPDPLGLFRARADFVTREGVLSLPRRYPMPRIHFESERHYQKGGVSLAMAVGDSQEFASLREYRPGDPRRHIHWRSFARTGKLIVKEYQDEYFDRHALVIDTHYDGEADETFEAAISVAASVAGGERPRDSILDVIFVGSDVVQLSSGRGLGDAGSALGYLAEAQPAPAADFQQLARLLGERAPQLASVIVVLTSRDAARTQLLDDLAAGGIATLSLLVVPDAPTPHLPQHHGSHHAFEVRLGHLAEDLARVAMRR
ncbi:MAG: DUF58 domain-containing protein [Gammaproteobacteria bacterium]